jgi:hypothetical protein
MATAREAAAAMRTKHLGDTARQKQKQEILDEKDAAAAEETIF